MHLSPPSRAAVILNPRFKLAEEWCRKRSSAGRGVAVVFGALPILARLLDQTENILTQLADSVYLLRVVLILLVRRAAVIIDHMKKV